MAEYAIILLKQGFMNIFRTFYPNPPTVKDKVLKICFAYYYPTAEAQKPLAPIAVLPILLKVKLLLHH